MSEIRLNNRTEPRETKAVIRGDSPGANQLTLLQSAQLISLSPYLSTRPTDAEQTCVP
jgi:hypothetical protein